MPSSYDIIVQGNTHTVIKPIAMLSGVLERKIHEYTRIIPGEERNGIKLEEISNDAFAKFLELGEIYNTMDDKEKKAFNSDAYEKTYDESQCYVWMNEIYDSMNSEQACSIMLLAEKLDIKFLIYFLGLKLAKHIDEENFFDE
jgi:hypothetical protein